MYPEAVYNSPEAKARYKQLEEDGILQVVKFAVNGFPELIRFGHKATTGDQLIRALGLLLGTEISTPVHGEDTIERIIENSPKAGMLLRINVTKQQNGQPILQIQRENPIPRR